jgi:hypothetical protein
VPGSVFSDASGTAPLILGGKHDGHRQARAGQDPGGCPQRQRHPIEAPATLLPRDFAMLAIVVMFTSKYGLWAAIMAHVTGALVNLAGAYWLSIRSSRSLKPL